jgi:hypothetical protein
LLVVCASYGFQIWSHHNGILGRFLKTSPIPLAGGLMLVAAGTIPLVVLELVKLARNRKWTASPAVQAVDWGEHPMDRLLAEHYQWVVENNFNHTRNSLPEYVESGRADSIRSNETKLRINPMNQNPLTKGMIEENSTGIGEISGEMVADRARELALIAGRPLTRQDSEQALRELTGGDAMAPEQALLESFSEDDRWDPIPGSTGHQAEESASEDEDEDGHGNNAQLFEEGVGEAAHDQMLEAARAAKEEDLFGN